MKLATGLIFLGFLVAAVVSFQDAAQFGPEMPATEDQIHMIRILSDQVLFRLKERLGPNTPQIEYIGVSSFRMYSEPDGRRIFLIRLQFDKAPEYWGTRVFQRDGYPLVLQNLFGPLRSADPLQES